MGELTRRLQWSAGVLRLTVSDPAEALERITARVKKLAGRTGDIRSLYPLETEWHHRIHERLGLEWPCAATPDFERLWPQIVQAANAQGVQLGRGTYGGWDDGDPAFAQAIWCLLTHLRPDKVIETGVARGVTSRVILEALERNGAGHLWSIDLPAMDPSLHQEIGIAVPEGLHGRWTFVAGTSRKVLPELLAQIGPIELFVHDSSHTRRNVRFELDQAWRAIGHGAAVADDVDKSTAFASFSAPLADEDSFVAAAEDDQALFGVAFRDPRAGSRPPDATVQPGDVRP